MQGGSAREVFGCFLKLGLTAFGGPVAHIGYFRRAIVERRRWIDEQAFAGLLALCQFLPGPASSQLGVAIGYVRAGYAGAIAAWVAFTAPSALLMIWFALHGRALASAAIVHGLKLAAVAIVAHAVVGMARTLTPDLKRIALAMAGLSAVLLLGAPGQFLALGLGAAGGLLLCRDNGVGARPVLLRTPGRRAASVCAASFALLLAALLAAAHSGDRIALLADGVYRAGALVFGGGHVVLPLLERGIVDTGLVDRDAFLAGYGAAQALPGPLFAFAAYLGALAGQPEHAIALALLALFLVFLPGMLLLFAALPYWGRLQNDRTAQAAVRGINAGVVGILAAAFIDPVWTGGVRAPADAAIALAAFLLLLSGRVPAWAVVASTCAAAWVSSAL